VKRKASPRRRLGTGPKNRKNKGGNTIGGKPSIYEGISGEKIPEWDVIVGRAGEKRTCKPMKKGALERARGANIVDS